MAEHNTYVPESIFVYGHDLKQVIDENEGQGHKILVCGDFNSEYSELKDLMIDSILEDLLLKTMDLALIHIRDLNNILSTAVLVALY